MQAEPPATPSSNLEHGHSKEYFAKNFVALADAPKDADFAIGAALLQRLSEELDRICQCSDESGWTQEGLASVREWLEAADGEDLQCPGPRQRKAVVARLLGGEDVVQSAFRMSRRFPNLYQRIEGELALQRLVVAPLVDAAFVHHDEFLLSSDVKVASWEHGDEKPDLCVRVGSQVVFVSKDKYKDTTPHPDFDKCLRMCRNSLLNDWDKHYKERWEEKRHPMYFLVFGAGRFHAWHLSMKDPVACFTPQEEQEQEDEKADVEMESSEPSADEHAPDFSVCRDTLISELEGAIPLPVFIKAVKACDSWALVFSKICDFLSAEPQRMALALAMSVIEEENQNRYSILVFHKNIAVHPFSPPQRAMLLSYHAASEWRNVLSTLLLVVSMEALVSFPEVKRLRTPAFDTVFEVLKKQPANKRDDLQKEALRCLTEKDWWKALRKNTTDVVLRRRLEKAYNVARFPKFRFKASFSLSRVVEGHVSNMADVKRLLVALANIVFDVLTNVVNKPVQLLEGDALSTAERLHLQVAQMSSRSPSPDGAFQAAGLERRVTFGLPPPAKKIKK